MGKGIFKQKNTVLSFIFTILKNFCLAALITLVFGFASGYKVLNILTGSMSPTMPKDTVVVIKEIPLEDVEVGDVITFKVGKNNVTHRVVEKQILGRNVTLKTQGDAAENMGTRETVTAENFVGVVIYHVKDLGVLLDIVKENIIVITVCIVLAMFIVVYS
ncbi:MAG: signal peptidase I [Clostridia bacterium]|nr:signal peptidase I [Clostridia bacterium]